MKNKMRRRDKKVTRDEMRGEERRGEERRGEANMKEIRSNNLPLP
jgi:hypothetical protein